LQDDTVDAASHVIPVQHAASGADKDPGWHLFPAMPERLFLALQEKGLEGVRFLYTDIRSLSFSATSFLSQPNAPVQRRAA
jgi:hypothetical protein